MFIYLKTPCTGKHRIAPCLPSVNVAIYQVVFDDIVTLPFRYLNNVVMQTNCNGNIKHMLLPIWALQE